MIELIALIIFLISLIGMGVIIIRKIPILAELPLEEIEKPSTLEKIKKKIKNNGTLKSFSGEILLQKLLSKIRIITLKTENKTGVWLTKLRKRSLEKKNKFSDDFWKKIKKENKKEK